MRRLRLLLTVTATRSWGANHKTNLEINTMNTQFPVNEKTLPQLRVAEVNACFFHFIAYLELK